MFGMMMMMMMMALATGSVSTVQIKYLHGITGFD
jgi:hypothetical protein